MTRQAGPDPRCSPTRRGLNFWCRVRRGSLLLLALAVIYTILGRFIPGLPLFPDRPAEMEAQVIPLAGPMADSRAEGSGLAWYKDYLIMLPQYPRRQFNYPGGAIFALSRQEIEAYLDGRLPGPLEPKIIRVNSGQLQRSARSGFEGFEAITFAGDQVFALIEAEKNGRMASYLVRGSIEPDFSYLYLDEESLTEIPLNRHIPNLSNEAITVAGDRLLIFYEANGSWINPDAVAYRYTFDLQPDGVLQMPNLAYRLTDATQFDDQGRFWVMNYFYPLEFYMFTLDDPLARAYHRGQTHLLSFITERIVELELSEDGQAVQFSGKAPVQLELSAGFYPRNWEGLVRLEGRGYLLLTDRYPWVGRGGSVFAFVPEEKP